MNKVTRRAVAAVIATIVGATALTGCGSDEDSKKNDGTVTLQCNKREVTVKLDDTGAEKRLSVDLEEKIPGEGDKVQRFTYTSGDFVYKGTVREATDGVHGGGYLQEVQDGKDGWESFHTFTIEHFKVTGLQSKPDGCPKSSQR